MSRPEHLAPPEIFYDDKEAAKYARSSRMQQIQQQVSERAIELLNLSSSLPCLLLDVGCGTGMSGSVLEESGHTWIGIDISQSMLNVAVENGIQEESNGDVVLADMGCGIGFRGGVFDGVISISALQWLCYQNKKSHIPRLRLKRFFQSLYESLRRGGRAVIQLYAETPQQMELITNSAMSVGFSGGLVIDYPNSAKAKKMYLVLMSGPQQQLPSARLDFPTNAPSNEVQFESKRGFMGKKRARRGPKVVKGSREWIDQKKERARKQGKDVKDDSKYTGRRRRNAF